jgi:hypothetical protein
MKTGVLFFPLAPEKLRKAKIMILQTDELHKQNLQAMVSKNIPTLFNRHT